MDKDIRQRRMLVVVAVAVVVGALAVLKFADPGGGHPSPLGRQSVTVPVRLGFVIIERPATDGQRYMANTGWPTAGLYWHLDCVAMEPTC